jgi:predicted phage tail protein
VKRLVSTGVSRRARLFSLLRAFLARSWPDSMLAFRMKKPLQKVDLERLVDKIDAAKWDAESRVILRTANGVRERVREASVSFSVKGAAECHELFERYQALVRQAEIMCTGLSLKEQRLEFKWDDAFEPGAQAHAEADWVFERACVLFNLAASLSFEANDVDRTVDGGPKLACNLYQRAAGCLDECLKLVRDGAWVASADMSSDTLSLLSSLMLAQAQKCFVEKAASDGMASATLAKLTAECSALYADVGRGFDEAKARGRPVSRMDEGWLRVVSYNRSMWDGMQHYHLGRQHVAANEFGKALSRFTYAVNKTAEAVNACSDAAPALQEQFKRAHALCRQAYDEAKRDNDLVHYEKVPPIDTLPKPARHCLVKPIVPEGVANIRLPTPVAASAASAALAWGSDAAAAPSAAASALASQMASASMIGGGSGGGGASAPPPPPPPPLPDVSDGAGGATPPPSFAEAEQAGLAELLAMGFERPAASEALRKSGGSVRMATEILLGGGS